LTRENPTWGYDRIADALANLGHKVSDQTVDNTRKPPLVFAAGSCPRIFEKWAAGRCNVDETHAVMDQLTMSKWVLRLRAAAALCLPGVKRQVLVMSPIQFP
jgi:hypothetical protein